MKGKGLNYTHRHSRGRTWAVDEWYWFNQFYFIRQKTWYFDSEEQAIQFKERKLCDAQEGKK